LYQKKKENELDSLHEGEGLICMQIKSKNSNKPLF